MTIYNITKPTKICRINTIEEKNTTYPSYTKKQYIMLWLQQLITPCFCKKRRYLLRRHLYDIDWGYDDRMPWLIANKQSTVRLINKFTQPTSPKKWKWPIKVSPKKIRPHAHLKCSFWGATRLAIVLFYTLWIAFLFCIWLSIELAKQSNNNPWKIPYLTSHW